MSVNRNVITRWFRSLREDSRPAAKVPGVPGRRNSPYREPPRPGSAAGRAMKNSRWPPPVVAGDLADRDRAYRGSVERGYWKERGRTMRAMRIAVPAFLGFLTCVSG